MSKHPSLIKQSPKEKTLREECISVAENAVREHIQQKMQSLKEAQSDPDVLAKLDMILSELKRKSENVDLERNVLLKIEAELTR